MEPPSGIFEDFRFSNSSFIVSVPWNTRESSPFSHNARGVEDFFRYYLFKMTSYKEQNCLIKTDPVEFRRTFSFLLYAEAKINISTETTRKFTVPTLLLSFRLVNFLKSPVSSVADPWHFGVDPESRSGSADPCLWLMDPDADLDPSIFIIDLQDANKKLILKKFFCIILLKGTFTSFFKDKKSKRKVTKVKQ